MLTLGPPEAEEQLRYAVSVGMSDAVLVAIEGQDWDPQRTARAITAAVTDLEREGGPFDLLLFGNESADAGGFQVGVRVAHALGRPMVNGAKGLEIVDGRAVVRRETDAGVERYELPLPAAVGVKEGINLPRYPTMKGRLASKKATIRRADVEVIKGGQRLVRLVRPTERASNTTILGHGADAAPAVVDLLTELGVRDDDASLRRFVDHDRGRDRTGVAGGVDRRSPHRPRPAESHRALTIGEAADAAGRRRSPRTAPTRSCRRTTSCSATTARRRGAPSSPTPSRRRTRRSCWHPAPTAATR